MSYVSELHRYPVKSLLGERIDATEITANGFPGDRAWAIRDNKRTLTGKKFPALMSATASFSEAPTADRRSAAITISLPNNECRSSNDADLTSWLTNYLDHNATLWPLVDATNLDFYRRATSTEMTPDQTEAALRAVFARLPHEALPDLKSFPAELLEFESPPGTYFDAYPLLLMSTQALATLTANATDTSERNFDMRRFRPNIVLDGFAATAGDFPENDLVGKQCQIGVGDDAPVLAIDMPCPRCIMTTHPVADLPKDPGIMRDLVNHNDGNLGVYARIVRPGTVRQGDAITVLDTPPGAPS